MQIDLPPDLPDTAYVRLAKQNVAAQRQLLQRYTAAGDLQRAARARRITIDWQQCLWWLASEYRHGRLRR
jgi:hypothetical protein